ncbi:MAG: twin-arginine translocation signal domain-containing protein, partial [Candidatus Binatia bacterium]
MKRLSRRDLLRAGGIGAATVVSGSMLGRVVAAGEKHAAAGHHEGMPHDLGTVGRVDHERNGF